MKKREQELRDRIAIITDVLRNHKGRMLTFKFTKRDGSVRVMNGRLGVSKGVVGSEVGARIADSKEAKGMINVYEIKALRDAKGIIRGNDEQWRTVNLNTLISVRMNHKELIAQ
jgi:hypothetical protein